MSQIWQQTRFFDQTNREFDDGYIEIVERVQDRDEYNTPIPNSFEIKTIGIYGYYVRGIHSNDLHEFKEKGIRLSNTVRIDQNYHIHSGMTARLNNVKDVFYDIVKVYQDTEFNQTEIVLAEERFE